MATYQASVGMHVYYSTNKSTWTEIPGLTKTPKKGGTPETVSLSIISEKFKRSLSGQQSMETFTYEYAPDFTASTGNVAIIEAMIAAGSEVWLYEEYTTGVTAGSPAVYTPGAGILYKGKPVSASLGEQSGSAAQTGEFSLDMTSTSLWIGSASSAIESKTYVDLMTGASATPLA